MHYDRIGYDVDLTTDGPDIQQPVKETAGIMARK